MALKVLLADDNITAQKMGSKILTDAGHTVVAVSNGAAAMKKIAAEKPELLILDVYMPGYTGLEVCQKVKSAPETARVPVLLTVTNMEPYSPEDGNRVKADGVLIKPFEATDLLAIVHKFEEMAHPSAPPEAEKTAKMPAMKEFEDASYAEWKAEAAPEEEVAKPPEMSQEVASAPALGIEDLAPAEPAPAFAMEAQPAEALAEPASVVAFDLSAPAPAVDLTAPSYELEHAETAAQAAPEIAPPAELEYTSAPRTAAMEIGTAAELEVTSQAAGEVPITRDAALVTDPSDMAQFATKFGEEHPEDIPVGIATPEMALGEAVSDQVLEETPSAPPVEQPEPRSFEAAGGAAAAVAPAREEEPVLEVGLDTQPLETPGAGMKTQRLERPAAASRTQLIAAMAEPEQVLAELISPAPEATPAEEAAAEPASYVQTVEQQLVAQFAAELEEAQKEMPPEAEPQPEMEPPAEAATAVAPQDDQRVAEAVSRVLERYKGELIAAIVRELKS